MTLVFKDVQCVLFFLRISLLWVTRTSTRQWICVFYAVIFTGFWNVDEVLVSPISYLKVWKCSEIAPKRDMSVFRFCEVYIQEHFAELDWAACQCCGCCAVLCVLTTRLPSGRWLFRNGTKNTLVYFSLLFCVNRYCVATEHLTVPERFQEKNW
jgi:hypothetical protein